MPQTDRNGFRSLRQILPDTAGEATDAAEEIQLRAQPAPGTIASAA